MDYEDFKTSMIKNHKSQKTIGIVFFIIFAIILLCLALFVESMPRVILIVPGIVSGLGLLVFFQAIKTIASIVDETHPVLIAIKSKTDFIVWIFQANQVEEGSERVVQKQVTAVDLNGKKYAFARSSEREVWEILDYLSSEFPNADVGYSDELRKSVSEKIGKKLRRTMGF